MFRAASNSSAATSQAEAPRATGTQTLRFRGEEDEVARMNSMPELLLDGDDFSDDSSVSDGSDYSIREERLTRVWKMGDENEWQKDIRRLSGWDSEDEDSDNGVQWPAPQWGRMHKPNRVEAAVPAATPAKVEVQERVDSKDSVSSLERVKMLGIKLIPKPLKPKTRVTLFKDEDEEDVSASASSRKTGIEDLTEIVPTDERRTKRSFMSRSLVSRPAWM